MKKMIFLMLLSFLGITTSMNAQVAIGTGTGTDGGPVAGAVLELDGTKGALLLPKVDALSAIATPVKGMLVYLNLQDGDYAANKVYIYDGTWNVYAGPQGPAGAAGATGATGAVGPEGPQGPIGLTGATGAQGPIGLTGADGADGAVGPEGPQGPIGLTGETGAQGPIGLTGAAGADGAKGDKGDTGEQGSQGLQGLKGDTGEQGPTGLTGATGSPGVKGDKGDTGAQGIQGPKGDTGATGEKGDTGPAGPSSFFSGNATYTTNSASSSTLITVPTGCTTSNSWLAPTFPHASGFTAKMNGYSPTTITIQFVTAAGATYTVPSGTYIPIYWLCIK